MTVRRRESSGTLTWSGFGTLKRSSMDVSSWWNRDSDGEHALEHVAAQVAVLLEREAVEVAVVADQRHVLFVHGGMGAQPGAGSSTCEGSPNTESASAVTTTSPMRS